LSPAGIRDILEVIVSTSPPERFSAFAKLHYAEGQTDGRAEGEPKGQARTLLRVLKRRGIPVDDHSRRRIESCTDQETLDTWADRAVDIDQVEDLFKE
jgi:hypothetical protein